MSIRRTARTRRVVAAVSMTAALALAVTACGSDDGGKTKDPGSSSSSAPSKPDGDKGAAQEDTAAGDKVDPNVKLAEVRGDKDMLLVVNEVKRDSGGFVTVQGELKNQGDAAVNPSAWAGTESVIVSKNLNSVGGATLVDKAGKKRYYILRDTDGRCLCTTGMSAVQPGKSVPVFMQFPAPPSTTTEVDLSLPTFATTSLKISG
ncbi:MULTISPECIES: hypothetical protein [unclassified Streptomyces]|uniref:hypothetical protein n=1 Tax=unclassified Streptomyces TaxID=2593676 RepID=UPI0029A996EB|nr:MULTISPECIES: hypothetical protein [unclassified Streptomyces]WTC79950.1 hypothetical protein OH719_20075 [Streptomyces sp. NBC_01653]WTD35502.1 hypothetical protein OHB03_26540 [Streptomyces sp. NBC_01643]WTD90914.1 hypothetical protein OG891_26805 [Streptomyces sp. NBC_01637]MDX3764898.1 hypothetical protein [Streptomyces sp. AK08-01B]MDX3814477.1 hypothetical protein [Streptomyces sp. AK08-01A]